MQSECGETYRSFSDEKSLSFVGDKDAYALETLYDRHASTIFQILHRIVHNTDASYH